MSEDFQTTATEPTGEVTFIRYTPPHGRRSVETTLRPLPIARRASEIVAAGYRFEIEVLSEGTVSLTIADDECDHAIELCRNGPEIPAAVDRLILGFKPSGSLLSGAA